MLAILKSQYQKRSLAPSPFHTPIRLWVDEAPRFLGAGFAEILQESRKFGLFVTFASQSYLQSLAAPMRESVRTNTSIKIIGRTSYQSAKAFADDTQFDPKKLMALPKHQFFYHYDDQPTNQNYLFRCPNIFRLRLWQRNKLITKQQWKRRRSNWLSAYYRKTADEPIPKRYSLPSQEPENLLSAHRIDAPKAFFPLH